MTIAAKAMKRMNTVGRPIGRAWKASVPSWSQCQEMNVNPRFRNDAVASGTSSSSIIVGLQPMVGPAFG